MSEPFDVEEANRLTNEAYATEMEFLDVEEMGARVDAEWEDARRAGDEEAIKRAKAANRRLVELCTAREGLWGALADSLEDMNLGDVRVRAEVIRQTAQDAFRRIGGQV